MWESGSRCGLPLQPEDPQWAPNRASSCLPSSASGSRLGQMYSEVTTTKPTCVASCGIICLSASCVVCVPACVHVCVCVCTRVHSCKLYRCELVNGLVASAPVFSMGEASKSPIFTFTLSLYSRSTLPHKTTECSQHCQEALKCPFCFTPLASFVTMVIVANPHSQSNCCCKIFVWNCIRCVIDEGL